MSDELKQSIKRVTGLSCEEMAQMSSDELDQYVEQMRGEKLTFGEVRLPDFTGEPLIDSGRIVTNEDIEKRIKDIL